MFMLVIQNAVEISYSFRIIVTNSVLTVNIATEEEEDAEEDVEVVWDVDVDVVDLVEETHHPLYLKIRFKSKDLHQWEVEEEQEDVMADVEEEDVTVVVEEADVMADVEEADAMADVGQ
jgi:hypothetical protein